MGHKSWQQTQFSFDTEPKDIPAPATRRHTPRTKDTSMTTNFSQTAAYIWSLADLLRGDFKQSRYGRVILPFTVLRRLECVLEPTKDNVLAKVETLKAMTSLNEDARETILLKAADQTFFNTSQMNLSKLGSKDIKSNLLSYIDSFSKDAREIFEYFDFATFVDLLDEANLLYKVVQKVSTTDLSVETISNHDMGLVFEELIRRFAESSNETAGEHFTPRDIIDLTTSILFTKDEEALNQPGIIRTIYDPTAGTGGFLSAGMEYVHEYNEDVVMRAFGQELNPESYAICKSDMLIKGQDVSRIKLGNTLSDDQLAGESFDYMLSNPPFGVDWKKVESAIKTEHKVKGFDGRFGPGLPRVSDGSLLFLMHLLDKMREFDPNDDKKNGCRIGIILNGSPLFTGSAGSGESEIRRYVLESDLLEAIIALPTDMFYNTGIATYIWVLSNKKTEQDNDKKGKVQLINAVHLYQGMRKSLGSKRRLINDDAIKLITQTYGKFEEVESYELVPPEETTSQRDRSSSKKAEKKTFASKIFHTYEFGYRRIRIERPLRLSAQLTDERLEELRFVTGKQNAAMQTIYEAYGQDWDDEQYGVLSDVEDDVRSLLKKDFKELKEKQIKELLNPQIWHTQKELLDKAYKLQKVLGTEEYNDFNNFDKQLKKAFKDADAKLDAKQKKQFISAVTWTNPDAEPVIKKIVKEEADPTYGLFSYKGKVVLFQADSQLRDHEDVPLTQDTAMGSGVDEVNEAYFHKEVSPHVEDAWIDAEYTDGKDRCVGVVGYEIPFNRHFYEYEPPRPLEEIDAELDVLSAEIMQMLQEIRS